jgi:predicted RNA-binding Zn-ribbon protein involved in translation (DUF1610 family)
MIVRCGACRTQFEVAGAGRFSCPACGSVNVVRNQAATGPASAGACPTAPGAPATPAAPPPDRPSPRINCPECAFTFIVGDIAVATCPNCGTEVQTGRGVPSAPMEAVPEEPVTASPLTEGEDPALTEEE